MDKPLHVQVAEALGCKPCMMPDPHGTPAWLCLCEDEHRPIYRPHGQDGNADLLRYDTDWSVTGPLIEKYRIAMRPTCDPKDFPEEERASAATSWDAFLEHGYYRNTKPSEYVVGVTPLIAVCNLLLILAKEERL